MTSNGMMIIQNLIGKACENETCPNSGSYLNGLKEAVTSGLNLGKINIHQR